MERILGYADQISIAPGASIEFKVSSPFAGDYEGAIVRLRCGDDDPQGPGLKETPIPGGNLGRRPARVQPIDIGSYVAFDPSVTIPNSGFALQCLVWPSRRSDSVQALVGDWDDEVGRGCALAIDPEGRLFFELGDAGGGRERLTLPDPLLRHHWYLVAASFDAARGEMRLMQLPRFRYAVGSEALERSVTTRVRPESSRPLRFAAWHEGDHPGAHFNGKLEAPRLATRPLDRREVEALRDETPPAHLAGEILGSWDFSREISGVRVVDASPHRRDGRVVQLPTRAVRGERWDGTVQRHTDDPRQYAAIHFHDDDLYDCGWDTDIRWTAPDDLGCGLYAAKLRQGEHEEYVPFYVRPRVGERGSKLCVLVPTASYYAYANWHSHIEWDFFEHIMNAFVVLDETCQFLQLHPELGVSMYDHHTDGSGVCFSSRLRPIPNMRPHTWQWQFNADTHLFDWLEELGFDYDVVTDDDLDAEGLSLIRGYDCVMTGTHPEYYSRAMLEALHAYRDQGGRLMYMGANGFYWKVSYHPDLPGVIEMRRAEDGTRGWLAEPGEYYHAFDAELGGLWRRNGFPPQTMAGTGFTAQGFDSASFFRRTAASFDPRVSFVFEGIGDDEVIGNFGSIGGGAAGWEIDRADAELGTPPHALVIAEATEFSAGYHWVKEEYTHAHSAISGETSPRVRADMVFFETPGGGAVFSTSSISWCGSLAHGGYRNNVSRITENVLRRFLDPKPF